MVDINAIEGCWSFAREPLVKYQGIDPVTFLFYPKEPASRYNYRDADLSDHLVETPGEYPRAAAPEQSPESE